MVNSKIPKCQGQRRGLGPRWAWRFAICALVGAISSFASSVSAQEPYYNKQYKIFAQAPAARVAHANPPTTTATSQPFAVEFAEPPAPNQPNAPTGKFEALSKAFSTNSSRAATPTGKVQDIFGENPQGDAFGEQPGLPDSPGNPFQKVDPQGSQVPENPFGEITPREDNAPQRPDQNPFSEIPSDPTPITPPMDTRPFTPQQNDPRLPDGSEFTPDPGQINPNPPIPGQLDPDPRETDPGELPDMVPDRGSEPDNEPSIFDNKEPERKTEPDDEDLSPVPSPNSSQVYLPAKTPTDYVTPKGEHAMIIPPGYYDPRTVANNNPFAKLPGPYGYPMPPYPMPNQGYAPYGYPPAPGMMPMPYGQCGPGCTPTNQCGSCNTCDNVVASSCGGCGSCGDCGTRPTLAGTEIADIGDRIVETGCSDVCAPETYVDVVSECDAVCSNFASCYIGLFGGWSDLNDFITRGDIGRGIYSADSGYMFGLTIGQIQGRNLRTELELSYRNISVNGLQLEGSVPSEFVGVNGDFGTFAGMFNGYWEFVDFGSGRVKPYVGGGIGFAIGRPDLIQSNGIEAVINNDDSSFAWQWMVGLNYKASPTLDAFVEYRRFVADSFQLDTEIPSVAGLGNGSGPFDYQANNVLFGLRARF